MPAKAPVSMQHNFHSRPFQKYNDKRIILFFHLHGLFNPISFIAVGFSVEKESLFVYAIYTTSKLLKNSDCYWTSEQGCIQYSDWKTLTAYTFWWRKYRYIPVWCSEANVVHSLPDPDSNANSLMCKTKTNFSFPFKYAYTEFCFIKIANIRCLSKTEWFQSIQFEMYRYITTATKYHFVSIQFSSRVRHLLLQVTKKKHYHQIPNTEYRGLRIQSKGSAFNQKTICTVHATRCICSIRTGIIPNVYKYKIWKRYLAFIFYNEM